jgi:hypothetical protein
MSSLIKSPADLANFLRHCQELFNTSKVWVAEFKLYRRPKTVPQLRLLFLWYKCISDETGSEVETIDKYFKSKYLGSEIKIFRGKEIEVPISKADLNTQQMYLYLESIRLEAMEDMNISLQNPGDLGWNEFYAKYGIE